MGGSACEYARTGASAFAFASASGISARAGLRVSAAEILEFIGVSSGSDTTNTRNGNEERGCAMGGLRRPVNASRTSVYHHDQWIQREILIRQCEEEPDAGGRIPSFPQTETAPETESPQAILARRSAVPRHLGASSPSGNARGGCRGCTTLHCPSRKTETFMHFGFNPSNTWYLTGWHSAPPLPLGRTPKENAHSISKTHPTPAESELHGERFLSGLPRSVRRAALALACSRSARLRSKLPRTWRVRS